MYCLPLSPSGYVRLWACMLNPIRTGFLNPSIEVGRLEYGRSGIAIHRCDATVQTASSEMYSRKHRQWRYLIMRLHPIVPLGCMASVVMPPCMPLPVVSGLCPPNERL
jgi:hypothetical protein